MSGEAFVILPLCVGCNRHHSPHTACPDGTEWWAGLVQCDVCTYRYAAVVPIPPGASTPPSDIECPQCHAMRCNEVPDEH
jgi:hypothetical protein